MARVTVEDCLNNVGNRFELVLLASKRARQIACEGKDPYVAAENDKPTVLALREIAEGFVKLDMLTATEKEIAPGERLATALAAMDSAHIDSAADPLDLLTGEKSVSGIAPEARLMGEMTPFEEKEGE